MSSVAPSSPEQDQQVSIRSQQWIVNDVWPNTLPPPVLDLIFNDPQNLLTPYSVEDDGLLEELKGIWELEPRAKVIEKIALPEPTGLSPSCSSSNRCVQAAATEGAEVVRGMLLECPGQSC